ncbi:hypothetical protein F4804DRAFT_79665 [Jackrogersella minutella]|nr:hypothetical protein F4804DRAFT_79665 [Jackrogersella minutella]
MQARKRLRRSTKSCYQCRTRKVKCQLTNETVETCAQCVKSGTRCTIEPPPEAELNGGGSTADIGNQGNESRLERIEDLLKRLVEDQERFRSAEASSGSGPTVPPSLWDDFLLQSASDGILPPAGSNGFIAIPRPADTPDAKQSLVALLPSAQDAVTIVSNTTAWLWGAETPQGSVLKPSDTLQLLDIAAISRGSAMDVAKTLLLFALYMQQLPANFDMQFSEFQSVEKAIGLIVEQVKLYVLSHESEACSLDGLECLTLLSLIQLNDGAIRNSWMTFRRVLDIARLEGLHNSFSLSARNSSRSDMALRRRLWLSTVCGDCYCSLLLGLEPGHGMMPFGPDDETWNDPLADEEANVQRRICLIVSRIARRNALGLHQDETILREVDEALNRLQDSMPASWWRAPSFRPNRSLESAKEPNQIICQLWFLQARIYAHMPIAFGKTMEGVLKSLENCMEASRITLHRYLGIQYAKDHLSRCRSVDQSAFLAAVVLFLAKVQLRHHKMNWTSSTYDSDRALLEQVIDSFEALGKSCSREHVARQNAEILSTMLEVVTNNSDNIFLPASDPSPDPNTLGVSFDPEIVVYGVRDTTKFGEDIIAASIQPVLDTQSPASRLINLLFATRRSASDAPKSTQELSCKDGGLAVDDLIYSTVLH